MQLIYGQDTLIAPTSDLIRATVTLIAPPTTLTRSPM